MRRNRVEYEKVEALKRLPELVSGTLQRIVREIVGEVGEPERGRKK